MAAEEQFLQENTDARANLRSQRFTTGPHLHGYEGLGLAVGIPRGAGVTDFSIKIYTVDGNGHPDANVAVLQAPEAFDGSDVSFTAPKGTVLQPNTTYALLGSPVNVGDEPTLRAIASDNEDDTEEGWSIADSFDIESGGSWSADPGGKSLIITVRAIPKAGPPGKPTGLAATAMARHQIDLSWTAPEQDGGADISGYQIEVSDDGGSGWTDVIADTGTDATTYEHTGLRPNTTLYYRVSAINSEGTSPASDTANATTEDFPAVTVQYGQDAYNVAEGATVNVTISLSEDPLQETVIPVTSTGQGGATSADYSVPSSVTFNEGETEKTIAFMAVDDSADDDDESVKLGFGSSLPAKVTVGTRSSTTLNIGDNNDPIVTVSFAQPTHTVAEGNTQQVTVNVSADPERTMIIPIVPTGQDGATDADYSVPPSVTFNDGEISKSLTFTATQDVIDDDGESVKLEFGTMPDARVSPGATDEVTLSITDDDMAALVVSATSLVVEEGAEASYTVRLDTEPTVTVTVTLSGHSGTDLTLSGTTLTNNALTFTTTNWNTARTVRVAASHDADGVNDTAVLTHTASGGEYGRAD